MEGTLQQFDQLRKHIVTPEGKKLMSEVRKKIKSDKAFSDKLYDFFQSAMDGQDAETNAKESKLL